MQKIYAAVSCNLDANTLLALLPLFEAEKIEAIEWSFDTLYKIKDIPAWFYELLQTFSEANRLTGHGVYFSLFSGKWTSEQQHWLEQLKDLSSKFQFDHITEHFGFMTGENFHTGAPLSIPFTPTTLAIGQDRLKKIYNACNCPVGLENLAFAYTLEDVKKHGDFLYQLLMPVNGFIILDLHNVYCQAHNFDLDYNDVINCYPPELVREIHISGGSWENSVTVPGKKIRRDTHDDAVPAEVFELLNRSINECPNLKYVVLEQLSCALNTDEERKFFRDDFIKLTEILQTGNSKLPDKYMNNFLPSERMLDTYFAEDAELYAQQCALSNILESATSYEDALQLLHASGFANTCWNIENWQPHMLETAISIAQKWKNGFA
jgi:uncharacterized protein (UPF0276 family)